MSRKKLVSWKIWLLRILCLFAVFFFPFAGVVSLIPFNEYGLSNTVISDGVFDCDTDTEAFFVFVACLVFAWAPPLLGLSYHVKAWRHAKVCWWITVLAGAIALRFVWLSAVLIHYSHGLAQLCPDWRIF